MASRFQTTLAGDVRISGVGVHGGLPANLTLRPAPADRGVVFVRTDLPGRPSIPARADTVCDTRLATVIGNDAGATVSTVTTKAADATLTSAPTVSVAIKLWDPFSSVPVV